MESNWLERTQLLVGEQALNRLQNTSVLIVGLGGVGSFAAEFITRSGIGRLTIVDGDMVDISNKNRQLVALDSTINTNKAKVMQSRIFDINPNIKLISLEQFLNPRETIELINNNDFDYVMDCIDSLTPKLFLIEAAHKKGVKIISSMGAGAKTNSMLVQTVDISVTHTCPFAHYIRKRLKKVNITSGVMTVFSPEPARKESLKYTDGNRFKKSFYGTISHLPAQFGLHMANWVINDILLKNEENTNCFNEK
jgi:tRNA A37 threonylcarbamoyladenosine dehydratase